MSWPSISATGLGCIGRCTTAARRPPPSWPLGPGSTERYAREWLEQQAVTGILDVDDVNAPAEARRFSPPRGLRGSPARSATARGPSRRSAASVVACAQGHAPAPRCVPDRWRRRVDRLRRRHDRGPGRLQPALAPRLVRHGDPAGASRRSTRASSADPPARVADVACGVGWAAIAIARPTRRSASTASTSTRRRSSSPGERPRRPASRDRVTFAVRDAADPAAAGQYDLVDRHRGDPRHEPAGRRSSPRSAACSRPAASP